MNQQATNWSPTFIQKDQCICMYIYIYSDIHTFPILSKWYYTIAFSTFASCFFLLKENKPPLDLPTFGCFQTKRKDVTCGFRDLVVTALQMDLVVEEAQQLAVQVKLSDELPFLT